MKRARRFPRRLVRWTSVCVCFALVVSCLAIVPFASVTGKSRGKRGTSPTVREGSGQGNGQERRVAAPTPQPGPPRAGLPNLDDLRRAADDSRRQGPREVHAPAPVPSTRRRWKHERERSASTVTITRIEAKAHHARGTSPTVREGSGFERASRAMRAGMPALPEPQGPDGFAMARIDPHNRTGTGGVDLLSNNFNWSLGLLGLKGRGGLDLGLSLSYNSLVWTRSSNYIKYDLDDSTVAPGFRR